MTKIARAKRRAVPYLQPGSGASVRAWLILFRVKLPASQQVASQRQAIAHALGRVSEDKNQTTPCLVISPFSAGGYKYSGTLDHTSTLRLIESRFKVTVPNLTAWRRSATGDFTGALALSDTPVTKVPALPSTSIGSNVTVVEEAVLNALTGTLDVGIPYPLPASNSMPSQETTPARPPVP